jgi:hypothetical protein
MTILQWSRTLAIADTWDRNYSRIQAPRCFNGAVVLQLRIADRRLGGRNACLASIESAVLEPRITAETVSMAV